MSVTVNHTETFPSVTSCYGNSVASIPLQGSGSEDSSPAGYIESSKVIIINYFPSLFVISHTSLATTTSFKYATAGAAGKQCSSPATYTGNLAAVLPLNGFNLSAARQGNNVQFTWDATGERNVIRYELEYSTNTPNFTPLASLTYRTTTSNTNTYTYTHLLSVSDGTIFYRVIQYRADGTTSISNQVSVWLNEIIVPFATVMPTLIMDMINVGIHTNTIVKTVINMFYNNGKVLNKKELYLPAGNTTFTLDSWL